MSNLKNWYDLRRLLCIQRCKRYSWQVVMCVSFCEYMCISAHMYIASKQGKTVRQSLHMCVRTYIHTCIHTYAHTYIHTYRSSPCNTTLAFPQGSYVWLCVYETAHVCMRHIRTLTYISYIQALENSP